MSSREIDPALLPIRGLSAFQVYPFLRLAWASLEVEKQILYGDGLFDVIPAGEGSEGIKIVPAGRSFDFDNYEVLPEDQTSSTTR